MTEHKQRIEIVVPDTNDLTSGQLRVLEDAVRQAGTGCPVSVVSRRRETTWCTIGIGVPGAWIAPSWDREILAVLLRDAADTAVREQATRSDWAFREDLLWVDIETRSSVDLKRASVYRYVESEDHEVQICSYARGSGPVQHAIGEDAIRQIEGLFDPRVLKVAHNANFERVNLSRLSGLPVGEYLPPECWIDTAELAAAYGYPRALSAWTKAMGGEVKDEAGTRLINMFAKPPFTRPEDRPEEFKRYVAYCDQDVASMRDAARRLGRRYPTNEQRVAAADKRINDRGVRIDTALAARGQEEGERNKQDDTRRVVEVTGVANPNSRQQLAAWLAEQRVYVNLGKQGAEGCDGFVVPAEERDPKGWFAEAFDKEAVSELLEWTDIPEQVREVLTRRQDMAKAASAKFEAALRGVSEDRRYRGALQYYGASTGRWAGRGLQLQNVSHDHWGDEGKGDAHLEEESLAAADRLLQGARFSMDDLSRTIRTMLVGPFLVCDYSAIEARVIAWLAGEQWRLDFFEAGEGDIYCESASRIFKVPVVKHGANGHLRAKGKVAELACLACGTLVATDHGEVPIQEVTKDMRVWDGEEFVRHDGVIFKGIREVLDYGGLTATPDHLVFVEGSPDPVPFGFAAENGARLCRTRARRNYLGKVVSYLRRAAMGARRSHTVRAGSVPLLRGESLGIPGLRQRGRKESGWHSRDAAIQPGVVQAAGSSEVPVHKRRVPPVPQLRGQGDHLRLPLRARRMSVGSEGPRVRKTGDGTRPYRQRQRLREGEPAVGNARREQLEQEELKNTRWLGAVLRRLTVALRLCDSNQEAPRGEDQRRDPRRRAEGRNRTEEGLASDRRLVPVYDIVNAGPRHRFVADGVLVHNCGYGGGQNAIAAMGGKNIPVRERMEIVDLWRHSNPRIVSWWTQMQRAVAKGGRAGRITVSCDGDDRWVWLPSGRPIVYRNVRREEWPVTDKRTGEVSWKRGLRCDSPRPGGGRLPLSPMVTAENPTQAVARDLLAHALLRLDKEGAPVVFHVHDEIVVEDKGSLTLEQLNEVMADKPDWAEGLPVSADGYRCLRYRKG